LDGSIDPLRLPVRLARSVAAGRLSQLNAAPNVTSTRQESKASRLQTSLRVNYTERMEVKLTPELEAKLDGIAAQQGRDAQSLVQEAVERLVGYDEWFVREVEKGLTEIERGEVLEHEEVGGRLEKLLSEKRRKP